jgi:hypothetical protein
MRNALAQAARLEIFDTLTHGRGNISVIERIVDVPERKNTAS